MVWVQALGFRVWGLGFKAFLRRLDFKVRTMGYNGPVILGPHIPRIYHTCMLQGAC